MENGEKLGSFANLTSNRPPWTDRTARIAHVSQPSNRHFRVPREQLNAVHGGPANRLLPGLVQSSGLVYTG